MRSAALLSEEQQLPTDRPQAWAVLVVVLGRQCVPFCNSDLVTARGAAIDAGVLSRTAWRMQCVVSRVFGFGQVLTVLVLSQSGLLLRE